MGPVGMAELLCHRYAVRRYLNDMGCEVPWVVTHGYGCASPTGFRRGVLRSES